MSTLEIPGAQLYYETHGSGPLIVLIPGAAGACEPYKFITASLGSRYTVVLYDRRGFSRSQLTGPQDYDHRIETDADDVRRLIEHLSGEPAVVFGGSSGAIVALEVLIDHPSVVRTLVAHEPPLMHELADGQAWMDVFQSAYDIFRKSGVEPAMQRFRDRLFAEPDRQLMAHVPANQYTEVNAQYWFEHELRQYPAIDLDLDSLRAQAGRILLMAGGESHGTPCHRVADALAPKLGRDVIEMPGGHIGYVARSAEFAQALLPLLQAS